MSQRLSPSLLELISTDSGKWPPSHGELSPNDDCAIVVFLKVVRSDMRGPCHSELHVGLSVCVVSTKNNPFKILPSDFCESNHMFQHFPCVWDAIVNCSDHSRPSDVRFLLPDGSRNMRHQDAKTEKYATPWFFEEVMTLELELVKFNKPT